MQRGDLDGGSARTLTRFTAVSIRKSLVDYILPCATVGQVVASGGGTRNLTLMANLAEELNTHRGLRLTVSDEFGMPAAFKEAIKFATLAFANKRGLANNIPAAGGAVKFASLGKLTLAPGRAKNEGEVVGRDLAVLGLDTYEV